MDYNFQTNFELYKIFYVTAQCSNLTAAAKALCLTQPNVSKHIRHLEESLGCQLFIRSKKGVVLTGEGESLFRHVEPACRQILAAEKELNSIKQLERGEISIVSSEMGFKSYVFPAVEKFNKLYPGVRIRFVNILNDDMFSQLLTGKADIAVMHSPCEMHDALSYEVINEVHEVMVCARNLRKILPKGPAAVEELMKIPIVSMPKGSSTYEYLEKYFLSAGETFDPNYIFTSIELSIRAIESSLAAGILPAKYAEEYIKDKKMLKIKLQTQLPVRKAYLITNTALPLNPAAVEFRKVLLGFDF